MNVIPFPTPASPAMTLSEPFDVVVAKRGRRPGVKTVSAETNERRRQWLLAVMEPPGANEELCRLLAAPDSFISHLLSGRRTFTDALARRIEAVLGLVGGAIDVGVFPPPIVYQSDDDGHQPARVLDEPIEKALLGKLTSAIHHGRVGNWEALQLLEIIIAM